MPKSDKDKKKIPTSFVYCCKLSDVNKIPHCIKKMIGYDLVECTIFKKSKEEKSYYL